MSRDLRITSVRLVRTSPAEMLRGHLGYASLVLDDRLLIDGIAVRRTQGGEIRLSFPARRDRAGQEHPFIRPLDTPTRVEIERQVLAAIGLPPTESPEVPA